MIRVCLVCRRGGTRIPVTPVTLASGRVVDLCRDCATDSFRAAQAREVLSRRQHAWDYCCPESASSTRGAADISTAATAWIGRRRPERV